MNETEPKVTEPIDVSKLNLANAGKAKEPTIIIRSEGGGSDQNKVNLLKKIITTQILLNILLILALAVSVYVSFVLRFDILKYFNKSKIITDSKQTQTEENEAVAGLDFRVIAADAQGLPDGPTSVVYINRHGVDLDKAFQASPSGILTAHGQFRNEVMGFLPYWAVPKLDQIDTSAVTSISYFGLEVDGNGEVIKFDANGRPVEGWTYLQKDEDLQNFIKKTKNAKLKVYLTLKAFNLDNIVSLTTSDKAREQFINAAIHLMNTKGFDGLNIDFEYIGTPAKQVRDGFSSLMIGLYKAMKAQNPESILTIDTFIDAASTTRIHDIPVLAENSDGLVIMGYDFHTPSSIKPGPVAPMDGTGLTIRGLMSSYLDKAPADKLILAVPYYGYDWPVKQSGKGFEVIGTKQQVNTIPYAEIIAAGSVSTFWDENAQVPWYTYKDGQTGQQRVVYFENVRSLSIKYDFIKKNNMQGIALWALGFDGRRTELAQTIIDKFSQ